MGSFPHFLLISLFLFFFFNDTAPTEIYTLSLHDALPISLGRSGSDPLACQLAGSGVGAGALRTGRESHGRLQRGRAQVPGDAQRDVVASGEAEGVGDEDKVATPVDLVAEDVDKGELVRERRAVFLDRLLGGRDERVRVDDVRDVVAVGRERRPEAVDTGPRGGEAKLARRRGRGRRGEDSSHQERGGRRDDQSTSHANPSVLGGWPVRPVETPGS